MAEAVRLRVSGRDFSPIEEASFSLWQDGRFCSLQPEESPLPLWEVLDAFLDRYQKQHQKSLRFSANPSRFGPSVGVVRMRELTVQGVCYDLTLQLGCRFDTGENHFFLAAMLGCGETLAPHKPYVLSNDEQPVFEILLFWVFRAQLIQAAQKGVFRAYRRFEDNSPRPRGALDIPRHIRLNAGLDNGRVAFSFREHTGNNSLNRLIAAACRRLEEKFPTLLRRELEGGGPFFDAVTAVRQAVGGAVPSPRSAVAENLRPIAHPYFLEYESLRRTCLKLLRDEGVSIFDAECCEETESLLEDVTRLWERFLESRLRSRPEPRSGDLRLTAQEERLMFLSPRKTSNPDFVFYSRARTPLAILDAKFKPHWNDFFEGQDSSYTDEDINKCIRDMVVFHTSRTGVIFPTEAAPDRLLFREESIAGYPECLFTMVRVPVPREEADESFFSWSEKLNHGVDLALDRCLRPLLLS